MNFTLITRNPANHSGFFRNRSTLKKVNCGFIPDYSHLQLV